MSIRIALCFNLVVVCSALAQPTTRPTIPLPSQFSDDRQGISIELAGRDNDAAAIAGTITLGASGSGHRLIVTARLDGGIASGTFTDDSGDAFACSVQMDGLRLLFKTGRTSYLLSRTAGGIGVVIDQTSWRVTNIVKDKPAEQAGIRVGDVITAVDGKDVIGLDFQSNPTRGPVYSKVQVTVRRSNGSTADVTMTRVPLDFAPLSAPPRVEDTGENPRDR